MVNMTKITPKANKSSLSGQDHGKGWICLSTQQDQLLCLNLARHKKNKSLFKVSSRFSFLVINSDLLFPGGCINNWKTLELLGQRGTVGIEHGARCRQGACGSPRNQDSVIQSMLCFTRKPGFPGYFFKKREVEILRQLSYSSCPVPRLGACAGLASVMEMELFILTANSWNTPGH